MGMKREKTNKKSKQLIVIERYEILQKVKKLKEKGIRYKYMEEILGVKEMTLRNWKTLHKRLAIRGLYKRSKKPNKIVEKQILTDSMLRIIEQTRKENLYYGKRKLQEMLLTKGYVLKLTTIEN